MPDANLESLKLNLSGDELIYEIPGDAQRGNPLDIVTIATAVGGRDVLGVRYGAKAIARRLQLCWNGYAARKLQADTAEAVINMAVARLGGTVEGLPTHRLNFLQRIDELVRLESSLRETT